MDWEFKRRVRYYETDRMGVVHHSNYLRLIEDARLEWVRDNIMEYREMEKMGIIIPCVSAAGNFKSFLWYDDEFAIKVKLVQYTGVRMKFNYEIYNTATGELCYTGDSVHCFSADGDYHPIGIKRKFPELHEKFLSMLESEKE